MHTLQSHLWSFLGKGDLPDWDLPASVASYLSEYEATLSHVWDMVDHDSDPADVKQLTPIFTTSADETDPDILHPASQPDGREDLTSLIRTQFDTRRQGVWDGFSDIASIQPRLCLRISRRVHHRALQTTLATPQERVRALTIGSASIQTLIILNNLLCYYRINEVLPDEMPRVLRLFVRRYLRQKQKLRDEIDSGLNRLEDSRDAMTPGDLVFLDSLTPFIAVLRKYDCLVSYLNRLTALSPLSLMRHITDDILWAEATDTDLAGIERLLDHHCPFQFAGPIVQHWVDLLVTSSGDEKPRAFDRIERIIAYLTSDRSASMNLAVPAIQTGRYCFQSFVRVLCRSWPDEERQEAMFESSPDEAASWYDILTRIQQHVDRVEHKGLVASPFIPVPERRLLEHALVLAQRKMAPGVAS